MSKVKTVCASSVLMLMATVAMGDQTTPATKAEAKPVQKWEFHGCAAIPVSDQSAAKGGKEPILNLALRLKEAAKTR